MYVHHSKKEHFKTPEIFFIVTNTYQVLSQIFIPHFISDLMCCNHPNNGCRYTYQKGFGKKFMTVSGFATVVKKDLSKMPLPGKHLGKVHSVFVAQFNNIANLVEVVAEQLYCHNTGQQPQNCQTFHEEFNHQPDHHGYGELYQWAFTTIFPNNIKTGFYRRDTQGLGVVHQSKIKVILQFPFFPHVNQPPFILLYVPIKHRSS